MVHFFLEFLKAPRSIGAVAPSGVFLAKKKFFQQYFQVADCLFELRNLPPAYVLVMRQETDTDYGDE